MNSPEKKILHLAFCLFVVGVVVRFLPWGLPSIEQTDIGEVSLKATVEADSSSKLEYSQVQVFAAPSDGSEMPVEPKKEHAPQKPKVQLPVHINRATADELCALKGVGPKLAEKIIAFREASGPFKTAEDLQKVPGIGKKKSEGILLGVIFD